MRHKSKLVDTDTELDYFVNPTLQELDTIESGHVRFIADDTTKQVYVCDGYIVAHSTMLKILNIPFEDAFSQLKIRYLVGEARKMGSKYIMSDDSLHAEVILKVDWSWIENYSIIVSKYINKLRSRFGMEKYLMRNKSKLVDTNTKVDYFVNPTLQELDTIKSGYMRFTADNNSKQIYCWDGYLCTHDDGLHDMGMSYGELDKQNYFLGSAKKKGSFYEIMFCDSIENMIEDALYDRDVITIRIVNKLLSIDWGWIENYSIRGLDYMSGLKDRWEQIKCKIKKAKFYDADKRTEYFVNPTVKELNSIPSGLVRFIADNNTKQVFVWDGERVLHNDAVHVFQLSKEDYFESLSGVAKKKAGKYRMINSDFLEICLDDPDSEYVDDAITVLNTDWSWVDYYINVSSYMSSLRSKWVTVSSNAHIVKQLIRIAEDILKGD